MPNIDVYNGPTQDPFNYIGFVQEHTDGFEAFTTRKVSLGVSADINVACDVIWSECLGVKPRTNGGTPHASKSPPPATPKQSNGGMLAAALNYAIQRGWEVFPALPGEKKSYKSAEFSNGAKWGKTRDPKQIRKDFRRWPDANIGIPTGADNKVWVLEADTLKGHKVDGIASLRGLEDKHGPLPSTLMAESPSGSLHFYFNWPDGVVIRNSVSVVAAGIDVRGEGGMVIAPPSVRADGEYKWLNDLPIADAPPWLIKLVVAGSEGSRTSPPKTNGAGLLNGAKVAEAFAHLKVKSLGEGIEDNHWFDRLKPEQKDEVVDHALEVIVAFLEKNGGHKNELWFRLTTAVARSGAPNAKEIFVRRASATEHPKAEDFLRAHFDRCQKDPPPECAAITVGTLLGLARDHGADFEQWRDLDQEPQAAREAPTGLKFINAGRDDWNTEPRGWLLGNVFCREFVSSLLGDGAVGKTALNAQYLSLVTGKSLTGEHVFVRSRVLLISLEDGLKELRRRIKAACIHHGIKQHELDGWLYYVALSAKDGKLMVLDGRGRPIPGSLGGNLEHDIIKLRADLLGLDPFVKTHSVDENNNSAIDDVVQILTDMADRHAIAIDIPHHVSKGPADPGNADRGRGASAMKDAARLVCTLTPMTLEEAKALGVDEAERRFLRRMDGGKVNIAPPAIDATWFRLVGVPLGNQNVTYPNGDIVQTVERWIPPDIMRDLPVLTIHKILDAIETGLPNAERYSDSSAAKNRAAWQLIVKHCPSKTEGPAKQIIARWLKIGLLVRVDYVNKARQEAKGLDVDNSRRLRGS